MHTLSAIFRFRPAVWSFRCQPTENLEKFIFVRSFRSVFRRLRRPSASILERTFVFGELSLRFLLSKFTTKPQVDYEHAVRASFVPVWRST